MDQVKLLRNTPIQSKHCRFHNIYSNWGYHNGSETAVQEGWFPPNFDITTIKYSVTLGPIFVEMNFNYKSVYNKGCLKVPAGYKKWILVSSSVKKKLPIYNF